LLPIKVKVNPPEVGLAVATGVMLAITGALYVNRDDPSKELAAPPPGTSTLRLFVPTPPGKTHVIVVKLLTLTPLQDLDDENTLDEKETTVFAEEVPKFWPDIVMPTPPEVGAPEAKVTEATDGAS
jgi:hypothetical protein